MKKILLIIVLIVAVTACQSSNGKQEQGMGGMGMGGMGMGGMGMGNGMMARHHATIPDEYIGLTNPVEANQESLTRGEEIYVTSCATCHGDGGMGDGPVGVTLDPLPAPIAHTSQMLGDDYLFWRISEGGMMEPFNSTMVAWKNALDEQARWDVINYVQALGKGIVTPRQTMGGATYDPELETSNRANMLAQGVEQAIITEDEATLFNQVHAKIDVLMATDMPRSSGNASKQLNLMLTTLVEDSQITQEEATAFEDIHDRLVEASLMQ